MLSQPGNWGVVIQNLNDKVVWYARNVDEESARFSYRRRSEEMESGFMVKRALLVRMKQGVDTFHQYTLDCPCIEYIVEMRELQQ